MNVSILGQLMGLYKNPDFRDKTTGEVVSTGKYKLELLVKSELSNGSVKHDMQYISIPDEQVKKYETEIGKEINIKCNYISKSQVNFYVS
jgi:hypothetical protein